MRSEAIRDYLPIVRPFLPENVDEPFKDDFLSFIFQSPHLLNLPSLLKMALFFQHLFYIKFEVA
jgi:hypothetical protein